MSNIETLPPLPIPVDKWEQVADRLGLTGQKKNVVELILKNQSDKQVGHWLNLKEGTVRTYMSRVFDCLQARSRTEVVIRVLVEVCRP